MKRKRLLYLAGLVFTAGIFFVGCSWPLGNARSEDDWLNSVGNNPKTGILDVINQSIRGDGDSNVEIKITAIKLALDKPAGVKDEDFKPIMELADPILSVDGNSMTTFPNIGPGSEQIFTGIKPGTYHVRLDVSPAEYKPSGQKVVVIYAGHTRMLTFNGFIDKGDEWTKPNADAAVSLTIYNNTGANINRIWIFEKNSLFNDSDISINGNDPISGTAQRTQYILTPPLKPGENKTVPIYVGKYYKVVLGYWGEGPPSNGQGPNDWVSNPSDQVNPKDEEDNHELDFNGGGSRPGRPSIPGGNGGSDWGKPGGGGNSGGGHVTPPDPPSGAQRFFRLWNYRYEPIDYVWLFYPNVSNPVNSLHQAFFWTGIAPPLDFNHSVTLQVPPGSYKIVVRYIRSDGSWGISDPGNITVGNENDKNNPKDEWRTEDGFVDRNPKPPGGGQVTPEGPGNSGGGNYGNPDGAIKIVNKSSYPITGPILIIEGSTTAYTYALSGSVQWNQFVDLAVKTGKTYTITLTWQSPTLGPMNVANIPSGGINVPNSNTVTLYFYVNGNTGSLDPTEHITDPSAVPPPPQGSPSQPPPGGSGSGPGGSYNPDDPDTDINISDLNNDDGGERILTPGEIQSKYNRRYNFGVLREANVQNYAGRENTFLAGTDKKFSGSSTEWTPLIEIRQKSPAGRFTDVYFPGPGEQPVRGVTWRLHSGPQKSNVLHGFNYSVQERRSEFWRVPFTSNFGLYDFRDQYTADNTSKPDADKQVIPGAIWYNIPIQRGLETVIYAKSATLVLSHSTQVRALKNAEPGRIAIYNSMSGDVITGILLCKPYPKWEHDSTYSALKTDEVIAEYTRNSIGRGSRHGYDEEEFRLESDKAGPGKTWTSHPLLPGLYRVMATSTKYYSGSTSNGYHGKGYNIMKEVVVPSGGTVSLSFDGRNIK